MDGLEGCLSAGLISGFGLLSDGLALPDGLVTVAFPDGLVLPDGLVTVAFPDGLVLPDGLVTVAFPDGLPSEREEDVRAVVFFLPEDDLVTEELLFEASFFVLEDALEYEEDDDGRELPRDCASISTGDTDNANPISIAARVFADNLMI